MKVKICGIQDLLTAKEAIRAGADFLGFVFAESKRKITVEKAKEIASYVPDQVKKVGVFVNPSLVELREVVEEVGLDIVQLHGDESPSICRDVPLPVVKAFSVKDMRDVEKANHYDVDYYLFDSPSGKYHGGSGVTFNWEMLQGLNIPRNKVVLAGGLSPDNVNAAITEVNPAMVDVSSGVETNDKKDIDKIRSFILAAKNEKNQELG